VKWLVISRVKCSHFEHNKYKNKRCDIVMDRSTQNCTPVKVCYMYTLWSIKMPLFYFSNSCIKNQSIFIIIGSQVPGHICNHSYNVTRLTRIMSLHYLVKHKIHVLGKWQWNAMNALFKFEMEYIQNVPKKLMRNSKI